MSPLGFLPTAGSLPSPRHLAGRAVNARRPAAATRLVPVAVMGSRTSVPASTQQAQTYTVKVMQSDRCTIVEVDGDTDIRRALLAEKIDLYTIGGKLRNCGGGGQCGTCIVSIEEGMYSANDRTPREQHLLNGKPDTFRLACRTYINGDCTIRMKPKA